MNKVNTLPKNESKIKVATPTWPKKIIEWPTVILFFVVYSIFISSSLIALSLAKWTWPFFILINSLCVYSIFTVLHEASHRNISRRYSGFEYSLGVLSGLLFHGSFEAFIGIHLRHHAKVNIQGEDPDLHASGPINIGRLLIWCGTMPVYLHFYFTRKMHLKQNLFKIFYPFLIIAIIYIIAGFYNFIPQLLIFWLLPSIFGVCFTVYIFDYLPHGPHNDTSKYTNAKSYPGKWIDWLMFMHNLHIIHHLWTSIPWYRYRMIYDNHRKELQAAGNIEIKLYK